MNIREDTPGTAIVNGCWGFTKGSDLLKAAAVALAFFAEQDAQQAREEEEKKAARSRRVEEAAKVIYNSRYHHSQTTCWELECAANTDGYRRGAEGLLKAIDDGLI